MKLKYGMQWMIVLVKVSFFNYIVKTIIDELVNSVFAL